ncbi:hypothetical protein A1OQ_07920 [Enterovibrio norvegicus FF-162]|uniref:Flagellar rod protein FlaI n=1 Tax=Enterovibrio norvegicus FF-454 TaxID=1185651 RepID=A0A1E5C6A0_9GAMM|nr:hypothetical protein [Enterovibrio norvegicus]OEE61020.1 hypothetical protein A1OK_21660 [Enterovibrio norvegicus FF-454]OEE74940.1 hypothetical protein A1OQ_07920 [Enterovibrio norvegicus FF-162]
MSMMLMQLETIDGCLLAALTEGNVDPDEMARLLNERKQCLAEITILPDPPEKEAWSVAISRTEHIYSLIKRHRDSAAADASRYLKGRKSVQIYKKFE